MKRLALITLLLSSPAQAQTSPAQMGITSTTTPEVLQVLDNTKTWVPLGTVDPTNHAFALSPPLPFLVAAVPSDGFVGVKASINSGSATLTASDRNCLTSDFGSIVTVAGAGAADGSAPLHTTLASCSGNAYTLANPSLFTLANTMWSLTRDASATLNNLIAAHPNSHILLPCGTIGLDAMTIALKQVWLDGCGAPGLSSDLAVAHSWQTGTVLAITTAVAQPAFTWSQGVRTSNFQMVWPGQYGVTPTPVAYGPAFQDYGSNAATSWYADHITAINPYDFFVQNPAAQNISTIHWDNVRTFAIRYRMKVIRNGEEISLSQTAQNANIGAGIGGTGYGGAGNLKTWADNNGVSFYLSNTGVGGGACAPQNISIKTMHDEIYDDNIAFQLVGANLQESTQIALDSFTNQFLVADAGSAMSGMAVNDGFVLTGNTVKNLPAVDFAGTCTGIKSALTLVGNQFVSQASLFNIHSMNMEALIISGNKLTATGTAPTGPEFVWHQDDPSTKATFGANVILAVNSGANSNGIEMVNALSATVQGNAMRGVNYPLDFSAYATGKVMVSGNATTSTNGPVSINGASVSANILIGDNALDKPFPVPANTGSCAINTQTGGNRSGSFKANGACAAGTVALGFATAAPTGWQCPRFADLTTPADAFAYTSSTTTSVTMTGTAASGDVIQFSCVPY